MGSQKSSRKTGQKSSKIKYRKRLSHKLASPASLNNKKTRYKILAQADENNLSLSQQEALQKEGKSLVREINEIDEEIRKLQAELDAGITKYEETLVERTSERQILADLADTKPDDGKRNLMKVELPSERFKDCQRTKSRVFVAQTNLNKSEEKRDQLLDRLKQVEISLEGIDDIAVLQHGLWRTWSRSTRWISQREAKSSGKESPCEMVSKSVNTAFNKIGDKRISQLSIHSEIAEIVDPDYQMKVNIPQWITTPIARSKWHLNGLAAWIDEWENRKRKMEREDTTSLLQEQLNLVQKEIQTIKLAEGEMLRKKATISAMKGPPQKIVRSNHEFEREFYYLKRKDQKLQEKHLELKKNISLWHEYYNSVNKILSAIQARERNERLLLKVFETRERDCFDSGNRQHSTTESKRLRERDEIFINRLVPAMERRSSLWEIWDTGMTGIDISTDISQRHLELVSNVYTTQWALDWLHSENDRDIYGGSTEENSTLLRIHQSLETLIETLQILATDAKESGELWKETVAILSSQEVDTKSPTDLPTFTAKEKRREEIFSEMRDLFLSPDMARIISEEKMMGLFKWQKSAADIGIWLARLVVGPVNQEILEGFLEECHVNNIMFQRYSNGIFFRIDGGWEEVEESLLRGPARKYKITKTKPHHFEEMKNVIIQQYAALGLWENGNREVSETGLEKSIWRLSKGKYDRQMVHQFLNYCSATCNLMWWSKKCDGQLRLLNSGWPNGKELSGGIIPARPQYCQEFKSMLIKSYFIDHNPSHLSYPETESQITVWRRYNTLLKYRNKRPMPFHRFHVYIRYIALEQQLFKMNNDGTMTKLPGKEWNGI